MSDSEYSEPLDVNGQDEGEANEIHMQLLQQQQQYITNQQNYLQQQNVGYMSYAGSTSSSGESSITSTSSDESDEGDAEDSLELAKINNEVLSLPRGLCENYAIFREFFSLETWRELPPLMQSHLQQFLPRFHNILPPHSASVEQTRTINMLFNNELTHFGESPLNELQRQLEIGNCRPDIIKLRQNILKSRRREQRFRECERLSQEAKQLFISRQKLLDVVYKSSPDTMIKSSANHNTQQPKPSHLFTDNKLSAMRARKRFYSEISQIAQQLGLKDDIAWSSDEDDHDSVLAEELKKDHQLRKLSLEDTNETVKTSTTLIDRCIYSTFFKKQQDVENEEAFRLQQKAKQLKLCNRNFKEYMREHKRRKLTEPTLPELDTSDIRLRDVCARAQMGDNFKRLLAFGKTPGRKSKVTIPNTTTSTSTSAVSTTTNPPATNSTICNMLTTTATNTAPTITQPITLTALPSQSMPLSKISEPPALVPIQTTPKKPETFKINSSASKSQLKEYHHQIQQHQHSMVIASLSKNHNSNNTLNIPLISVSNHADSLNLCMDDSTLLTADNDAFNMLDNEVELQQEEVETFGDTCEESIPTFALGSNAIPSNQANNDVKTSLLSIRSKGTKQHQQMESVPKLEPIPRSPLITAKSSSSSSNSALVSELIQETHACYFSLIRDFFCSTPNHRMRYDDLRNKIDVWLRNPITALNEWYSLSENWSNLLKSAVQFLVGEFPDLPNEYVPYIEHKVQLNIYQWIGAGRDSDNRLSELCTLWMERRKQPNDKNATVQSLSPNEQNFELYPRSSVENDDSPETDDDNGGGLTPPPPPPRCPTNWKVRAATLQEISEFQKQERDRFEQPHKSYTYRMHGYESVVGPVKGIYTPLLALSKARGHSMMVGDRPNFVTILTLVRDATARLPNGEGTRAEISELLKCSQYINPDASENVLQTIVSGALDRMHTEHDPCVRYEPKRKIWIYLHRSRTEDELERIHHENQTIVKAKKPPQKKPKLLGTCVKPPSIADSDNNSLVAQVETSNGSSTVTGSLLTMPALVPANPIIVTNNNVVQRQQQVLQQHMLNTNKCPPVPPLKYNIPPSQTANTQQQQQQKSLLKSAVRSENQKINAPTSIASTSSNSSIKQHSFQIPQSKSGPNQNTTPIIVATPQGLQTVHVSNATSVVSSQSTNHQQQQQYHQQISSPQQHRNNSANLVGKRVTLNKPIIINQVTAASSTPHSTASVTSIASQKLKSPQQLATKMQLIQNRITLQTNQHQLLTQQQQQSNLIIPITMANNMSQQYVHQQSHVTEHNTSIPQVNQSASIQSPASFGNKQNIIRLVSASNVKSLINTPATNQMINRQRIIAAPTTTDRPATPQQQQQKSQTGLQLVSNNGSVVTVGAAASNPAGSIVKMSPQQFASFQQKQSQQQHIFVKQAGVAKTQTAPIGVSKPQRVILGQTGQGKNLVLQQIPVATSSVVVAPSHTTTVSSATPTVIGNKIQTINAKSLTPQQQRILIQNLKQQQQQQQHQQQQTINQNQIQFKTVQVMTNNSAAQRPQTVTVATTQQTMPKNVVVVSRDNGTTTQSNVTRILKTTSPQLKSEISAATAGTRVITSSSGQIITLDSLIHKQGGTLRIAGAGNQTQTINSNQQLLTTNILQKTQPQQVKQQQQPQQFAIVSVPNSIISLNNNSNFTIGQRVITTQAGSSNTTTLVNLDTTKVTPSIVSTGAGRVITATAAGTKIITKQLPAASSTGNIRVVNAVNKTTNMNLATLQGKQVVLTTGKTLNTIGKAQLQSQQQQKQQQNIVQAQQGSIVIGGQTVKLQQGNTNIQQLIQKTNNIITSQNTAAATPSSSQLQTVIMGNQILRVQQIPQIISTGNRLNVTNTKAISNNANSMTTTNSNTPRTIFVGSTGQTLRLQPATSQTQTITNKNIVVQSLQQNTPIKSTSGNVTTTPNRVVLAVQGGGQIFLSPSFQGGNINLKSLQNMKVVSLAQHPSGKFKDTTSSTTTSASPIPLATQKTILKTTPSTSTSDTNI